MRQAAAATSASTVVHADMKSSTSSDAVTTAEVSGSDSLPPRLNSSETTLTTSSRDSNTDETAASTLDSPTSVVRDAFLYSTSQTTFGHTGLTDEQLVTHHYLSSSESDSATTEAVSSSAEPMSPESYTGETVGTLLASTDTSLSSDRETTFVPVLVSKRDETYDATLSVLPSSSASPPSSLVIGRTSVDRHNVDSTAEPADREATEVNTSFSDQTASSTKTPNKASTIHTDSTTSRPNITTKEGMITSWTSTDVRDTVSPDDTAAAVTASNTALNSSFSNLSSSSNDEVLTRSEVHSPQTTMISSSSTSDRSHDVSTSAVSDYSVTKTDTLTSQNSGNSASSFTLKITGHPEMTSDVSSSSTSSTGFTENTNTNRASVQRDSNTPASTSIVATSSDSTENINGTRTNVVHDTTSSAVSPSTADAVVMNTNNLDSITEHTDSETTEVNSSFGDETATSTQTPTAASAIHTVSFSADTATVIETTFDQQSSTHSATSSQGEFSYRYGTTTLSKYLSSFTTDKAASSFIDTSSSDENDLHVVVTNALFDQSSSATTNEHTHDYKPTSDSVSSLALSASETTRKPPEFGSFSPKNKQDETSASLLKLFSTRSVHLGDLFSVSHTESTEMSPTVLSSTFSSGDNLGRTSEIVVNSKDEVTTEVTSGVSQSHDNMSSDLNSVSTDNSSTAFNVQITTALHTTDTFRAETTVQNSVKPTDRSSVTKRKTFSSSDYWEVEGTAVTAAAGYSLYTQSDVSSEKRSEVLALEDSTYTTLTEQLRKENYTTSRPYITTEERVTSSWTLTLTDVKDTVSPDDSAAAVTTSNTAINSSFSSLSPDAVSTSSQVQSPQTTMIWNTFFSNSDRSRDASTSPVSDYSTTETDTLTSRSSRNHASSFTPEVSRHPSDTEVTSRDSLSPTVDPSSASPTGFTESTKTSRVSIQRDNNTPATTSTESTVIVDGTSTSLVGIPSSAVTSSTAESAAHLSASASYDVSVSDYVQDRTTENVLVSATDTVKFSSLSSTASASEGNQTTPVTAAGKASTSAALFVSGGLTNPEKTSEAPKEVNSSNDENYSRNPLVTVDLADQTPKNNSSTDSSVSRSISLSTVHTPLRGM